MLRRVKRNPSAGLSWVSRYLGVDRGLGPLPVLMLMLTVGSGLIDAISYLALGRVFVANMTGNVLFLGFAVAGVPGFGVSRSLLALAGFVVGAFVGGLVIDRSPGRKLVIVRNAIAGQAVLITACFGLGLIFTLKDDSAMDRAVIFVAATAMGLQNATARKVAVPDMPTTVVTTTLTAMASEHSHGGPHSAFRRVVVVTALFAGAITGATLVVEVNAHMAAAVLVGWLAIVVLVAARQARSTSSD